jgi:hypothetical protein
VLDKICIQVYTCIRNREQEGKNMKARLSEEYYRKNWDRFIKGSSSQDYMNLEKDLIAKMSIFQELPEKAIEILTKIKAQEIVDETTKRLYEKMAVIKQIETGNASLGYTTQLQETQARQELVTRFEFNCLQLADFKKKYLA